MRINFYIFFVGLRYFFIKRKDHFGAFISLISILGIALGVAVLITVLSVMNGFSKEIRAKILSNNPHITVKSFLGNLNNWPKLVIDLKKFDSISGIAPFISQYGLLMFNGYSKPVVAIGIDPKQTNNVYPLSSNLISGKIDNLSTNSYYTIITKELADNLSLVVGDVINLIIPEFNISAIGINSKNDSKIKQIIVGGILKNGTNATVYGQNHIFLSLKDISRLYKIHDGVTGIQLKVRDELRAPQIAREIDTHFEYKYSVVDWTLEFKAFFDALQMEKTVMGCILLLIIAVAGFNLVSSLIMLVMDKRSNIAILRVMGATREEIMCIFMLQGTLIGILGILIGVISGLLLSYNITSLVAWIERLFKIQFVTEEAYFINFVPSDVHANDILLVVFGALIMSFMATLYPAWRASNIKPAEALRYE